MHEIRFCRIDERDKLMRFIQDDWCEGHILARDVNLLAWQHNDRIHSRYNFVVAADNGRFDAILGFIPTYQYDIALQAWPQVWLAIWKSVAERAHNPVLGRQLLEFLEREMQPVSIGAIGINARVEKLYRHLGYTTGMLDHYYIRNPYLPHSQLLCPPGHFPAPEQGGKGCELFWMHLDFMDIGDLWDLPFHTAPRKSAEYFRRRYLIHPTYRYRFLGAWNGYKLCGVFVVRCIEANGAACLRIVDFAGCVPFLGSLSDEFVRILHEEDAEYVDAVCHGIDFTHMGFSRAESPHFPPNHFEPFEVRGEPIRFAYKSAMSPYVIMKGDSDQDRPNR